MTEFVKLIVKILLIPVLLIGMTFSAFLNLVISAGYVVSGLLMMLTLVMIIYYAMHGVWMLACISFVIGMLVVAMTVFGEVIKVTMGSVINGLTGYISGSVRSRIL